MALKEYRRKRDFRKTPEPEGSEAPVEPDKPLRWVVQMHRATRLHFDLRLEMGGVFKSWAVPKGPSLNPNDQRLAVFVEDHPIEYGSFEGVIPKGNYGAGTVLIWDAGTYHERSTTDRAEGEARLLEGLERGRLTFVLTGRKIGGEYALVRLKDDDPKSWLLLKKRDEYAVYRDEPLDERSVATGRTMDEIAAEAEGKGEVWLPTGALDPTTLKTKLYEVTEPLKPKRKKRAPSVEHFEDTEALPSSLAEARDERMPRRVKPMLPTVETEFFAEPGWYYELAWSGFRAIAEVEGGRAALYSKSGLDYRKRFPALVRALERLDVKAVLDGEIAVLDAEGLPVPDGPRSYKSEKDGELVYFVYDLLHLDGKNVRDLPLAERKRLLSELPIFGRMIRYGDHEKEDPEQLFRLASSLGHESVLARDAASPYRSGTSKYWRRIPTPSAHKTTDEPHFTHLDKVYWREEGITKGDLIDYYRRVASVMLPHMRDRPQSLHRHPNGIEGESFFHKDMAQYLPPFAESVRIASGSAKKSINYLLCQNRATLLYMANLGCIEMNPWLSRVGSLDRPDFSVIDLDPHERPFSDVIAAARLVHEILSEVGCPSFPKTSGSTGMHIVVPLGAKYDYDQSRAFAEAVCQRVHERMPDVTSLERNPSRRRGKMYLDYMQNARGQTIAAPYCVRPRPGALVSAPLSWDEVDEDLDPKAFTLRTMPARVARVGDLWQGVLGEGIDLEVALSRLKSEG